MKKLIISLFVVSMVAVFSTTAFAAISGGPHDLSDDGLGETQMCKFCHVPHNPQSTTAPLWNRSAPASQGTFTLYDGTAASSVTGTSIMCLSCHDGVTNLDAFGGTTGTAGNDIDTVFASTTALVGTDLQDDHPVSVVYGTAGTGDGVNYKASPDGDLTGQLESTRVECGTCHDAQIGRASCRERV